MWALVLVGTLGPSVAALFALWLRAGRRVRRLRADRAAADRSRIDGELLVAELQGRLAIIRELQDVAVVTVSRLITRAEGARYTAESDPSSAVRVATALVDDGRGALADMRRVLTVAREERSMVTPRTGLHSILDLVGAMRDSGLVVELEESGDRFPLKPGSELTIFRILQGALANSLHYGGPGTDVRVAITWLKDGLQLLIDDDGIQAAARRAEPGAEDASDGTYTAEDDLAALTENVGGAGITQMRERAELFGGVFTAGAVPGVGFSVAVVFPALRFHNGVHAVDIASA